jgi:hypothetical protein
MSDEEDEGSEMSDEEDEESEGWKLFRETVAEMLGPEPSWEDFWHNVPPTPNEIAAFSIALMRRTEAPDYELWQDMLENMEFYWKRYEREECEQTLSAEDIEKLIAAGQQFEAEQQKQLWRRFQTRYPTIPDVQLFRHERNSAEEPGDAGGCF